MRNSAPPGRRIMRLRLVCSFFALLCSALVVTGQPPAPSCADLHIVPAVRECTAVKVLPTAGCLDVASDKSREDEVTAADLKEVTFSKSCALAGVPHDVRLLHAKDASAKELIAHVHL